MPMDRTNPKIEIPSHLTTSERFGAVFLQYSLACVHVSNKTRMHASHKSRSTCAELGDKCRASSFAFPTAFQKFRSAGLLLSTSRGPSTSTFQAYLGITWQQLNPLRLDPLSCFLLLLLMGFYPRRRSRLRNSSKQSVRTTRPDLRLVRWITSYHIRRGKKMS